MERYVRLLYAAYFGRRPTAGEVAFHANSGLSREQLALNFLSSPELEQAGRYVAGLYVGILNRDAEYGGWLFQRDAWLRGLTNEMLLIGSFLNSAEFTARFGKPGDRDFVIMLYRNILLLERSAGEADWHAGNLTAGMDRARLARNFLASPEFAGNLGPRLTAYLAYAPLLQRQPTAAEFGTGAAVVARARAETPANRDVLLRDLLLAPILNSAEFAKFLE